MNIRKTSTHARVAGAASLKLHAVGRAARQTLSTPRRPGRWEGLLLGVLTAAAAPALWAAPEGGVVAAGQAQVGRAGTLTTITQQSRRAVIDWRSFNVGAAEAVDFRQPDAASVTLNRVLGPNASSILGRLTANGSVFIVNPNGVLFGQGAQVNVGGLVASTANISNANFMAGIYRFDQPSPNAAASVRNEGVIRVAANGIAALVGRQVSNSGFIVADLGKVALAGGDAFVLDLGGDRLVNLILDASLMEQLTDAQGQPLIARVDNTGNIRASGGRVELTADTVSTMLNNVINVGGDIRATSLQARDGVISLTGGATTDVRVTGVVQAGGTAGRVDVAGRDIVVASTAQVDLGLGADLDLNARRNLTLDASINALRDGSVAGGALTATAGNDLTVNQTLALNDAALTLTSTGGRVATASRALLQTGSGALNVAGSAGVALHDVLAGAGVDVRSAAGAVDLNGTIVAGGAVRIEAGGSLTVSPGGIRSSGAGSGISLTSTGDLQLQGDLQANAATIALISGGAVTARVLSPGSNPTAVDAVIDAGLDATASRIVVRADGDVTLGGLIAQREADIASANGSVLLLSPLGGSETGYRDYAGGYRGDRPAGTERSRPNVGVLTVGAPNGSVELNGLNLDGLADPMAGGHGLRVTAGHLLLSNSKIAVNKGDIVLAGGQRSLTDPSLTPEQRAERERDGVYLGDSVFSRGWDSVGSDGARDGSGSAQDLKIGYSITLRGRSLVLFDNTSQTAALPAVYRVLLSGASPSRPIVHTDVQGYVIDLATGLRVTPPQRVNYDSGTQVVSVVSVDTDGSIAGSGGTQPTLVLGIPVSRDVTSIEISNNSANYANNALASGGLTAEALRSALVPVTGSSAAPPIVLDVTTISGMTGSPSSDAVNGGRRTLADLGLPTLVPLSSTPNYTATSGLGLGIALKLLTFDSPTDTSTLVWGSSSVNFGTTSIRDIAQLPPGGVQGGNPFFPFNLGPITVTTPVRGEFVVATATDVAFAYRSYFVGGVLIVEDRVDLPGGMTFTMRQLPRELSGWAQVVDAQLTDAAARSMLTSVGVPPEATGVTWSIGADPRSASGPAVGNFATIRLRGLNIAAGGVSSSIQTSAGLLTGAGVTASVANGSGLFVPSFATLGTVPPFAQAADGTVALNSLGSSTTQEGVAYSVARVVVDSSAAGAYPASEPGTRVLIYDGALVTQGGRAVGDSGGGPFVPGIGGTSGSRNDSATRFTSVGGQTGSVAGAAVGGSGSFGAAADVPLDPGFAPVSSTPGDRAAQDALGSAQDLDRGSSSSAQDVPVELGFSPAAQADLGRGTGLSGAARNVFKRAYRLASSPDGVVCVPDAIEPTAQKPLTTPERASASPGNRADRDCKPAAP